MFEAMEIIPLEELEGRWKRLRSLLEEEQPLSGGIMVFSRVLIYWCTGHFGSGTFWLPKEGEPFLFIRKGIDRAKLESSVKNIFPYRSYSEIKDILEEHGENLPEVFSVEMGGLSWNMGKLVEKKFSSHTLLSGDRILSRARAVKTSWELEKMSLAGERHFKGIYEMASTRIRPLMSEREMAIAIFNIYFDLGHCGIIRMQGMGEELFMGHVCAGDSGNYPTCFNGPVGARGIHPAMPHFGYHGKVWNKGEVLMVDTVFSLEGYFTDKSQVFFAGRSSQIPDGVKRAQDFCIEIQNRCAEMLKPGTTPSELYEFAISMARKKGFEEGFMGLEGNKVPFIGHGIGLYLDEWPPIARGFKEGFEENMVIALEPKIGIEGVGMVGVENTFCVTPQGGRCLTGDKFDIICVE